MSTTELKDKLIYEINQITDDEKLKELLRLLRFQSDSDMYVTNEEEKNAIREAEKQIENGDILTVSEFRKEMDEWLKK